MRHIVAVSALSLLLISATPSTRIDPYKNYKFRVSFGGAYVAAFSQVTQQTGMSPTAAGAPNGALGGGLFNSSPSPVPTNAAGSSSGVPIRVPGSLIGQSGTVTLICTAQSRRASNVTLVCSIPPSDLGGGLFSGNSTGAPAAKKAHGFTKWEAITLERGVTTDPSFQSWASSIRSTAPRDISVDIFNEANQRTGGYRLTGCTVMTFQRVPGPNGISVVALELHCNPQ